MFINWALQEISLKIVYYGPGLSGKTTNLQQIYDKINPAHRGEMVSLKTMEERTIFFDFMQFELPPIHGKKPKFSLYTVPGQYYYAASRRIILNGTDGVVFVADSQENRLNDNLDSILDLEQNLIRNNRSLEEIPWVLQYNKQDLHNNLSIEILQKKLNYNNVPYFSGVATKGIGVSDTLKTIINNVIEDIERRWHA
ncbi:GTPase domain-containing protein [candidate division KSB1 bacterium]|nr:GTPase domain-containing protein [candidate division KSB1 bacterium]